MEQSRLRFSASNPPLLRLKHRAIIIRDGDTFSIGALFEVMVVLPVSGFLINVKSRTGGSLSASITRPMGNLGGSLGDLVNIIGGGLTESVFDPSEAGIFDGFELWKVSMKPSGRSDFESPGTFIIGMFVTLNLPGHPATIGMTYDTASNTFSGQLLLKSTYQDRLSPTYDELEDLPRGMWMTLPDPPDLRNAGPFSALPRFVPTKLDSASITYTKGSNEAPYEMSFSGSLISDNAAQNSGKVPFPFDWSGMTLEYFRQGTSSGTGDDSVETLSLSTTFELDSISGRFESGTMDLKFISTTDGNGVTSWSLGGSVQYIQLGAIAEFIDPRFKDGVFDVIGQLSLDALEVLYTWDETSSADSAAATSFLFSGTIGFGELKLRFFYQYASADTIQSGKTAASQAKAQDGELNKNLKVLDETEIVDDEEPTWRFDAYLDVGSAGATIGMIADSIVSDASKSLPPFVRDIEIQPPMGSDSGHLVSLHTGKATKKANNSNTLDEGIIFLLNVSLSSVEFSFEQLSFPGSETKRLLRVSVGKLPLLNNLPVVRELPQPWSKLQYMWIPEGGFSRNEVALLNEKLEIESPEHRLFFKPATRDAADKDAPGDPTVLVQGHHFIVVVDNEAILDHVFQPDVPLREPPDAPDEPNESPPGQPVSNAQEKPPAKGSMTKQLGILDVSGLSLQYKNDHLYIFVDATVKLGPISFSLIGFGVGINISKLKLNDLSALGDTSLTDLIDFQLHGMEVSFDNPPILIAGCFYHDVIQRGDQTIDAYRGGIGEYPFQPFRGLILSDVQP